ncbi:MAG TPA: CGNR zinc finger domain-containing protein [Candidatus Binatia bacterium]|nr:CGNR zinc finger domain-containing protein [Candidatus Binatia bacterium]
MQLRLLGGQRRPALQDTIDFINTLEHSRRGDMEHLPTLAAARDWLAERGLVAADVAAGLAGAVGQGVTEGVAGAATGPGDAAAPDAEGTVLVALRRARAAFRAVVDAIVERRPPDEAALAEVNRLLAGQPAPVLVAVPDGVVVAERPVPNPLDAALARLAEPIVELIESGERERLRTCANPSCRWVFFDESRPGRRRWCEMATCGNRAKAARHRARRASRSDGPDPDQRPPSSLGLTSVTSRTIDSSS